MSKLKVAVTLERRLLEDLDALVAAQEYEAEPSPDGMSPVISTDRGLYLARRAGAGWASRVRWGSSIPRDAGEIGPLFSPSGKSLLFSRDTGEPRSGECFVWRIRGHERWHRECAAK